MKNINMIKVFMKENGIDFDKEFYVDFGEEQEVFNIDNFKKYTILQNDDYIYFEDDTGEDISYEKMGKIDEHKKLLEVLLHHKGPVVVSSYTNKLYDEWLVLENGWDKKTIKVQANAGKSTLECIYLNRMCDIEISLF